MRKVGLVYDELFIKHINGIQHPECPERVEAIMNMLIQSELINQLEMLQPRDATKEEITVVHDETYYDFVASTKGIEVTNIDADTSTNPYSFDAAIRGSGGFISSLEKIANGELNTAFTLPRPPGHHAERDRAMGFCLFNHVAVGASYLLSKGFKRILIVDWDVHHGNGTQYIFYHNPNVLFFSIHQFPFYPGTGSFNEKGTGEGEGFTVNIPSPPMLGDNDYLKIFHSILKPVIEQYKPDFILVSSGFDAYFVDPLGGMKITEQGFAKLTRFILNETEKHCEGKVGFLLEGGYNIQGLSTIMKVVIEEILDINTSDISEPNDDPVSEMVIEGVKETYSQYWKF